MKKVKCVVCANSDGKRCKVKDVKVAQKKSRVCDKFEFEVDKVQIKNTPPSDYVPPHLRSRKEYKRYLKEEMKKAAKAEAEQQVDFASPDILSRFRSSAGTENA